MKIHQRLFLVIVLVFSLIGTLIIPISTKAATKITLSASMNISWKSSNERAVSYIDLAGNGYKGLKAPKEYKLIDSKGKVQYRYKSLKGISASALYKDGTAYLVDGSENIIALNKSGKVKWKKRFSKYTGLAVDVAPDGDLYITRFFDKKWYIIGLDSKNGKQIWISRHQGGVALGSNDTVLIPKGDNWNKFSYYKNGKIQWTGTTPSKNHKIQNNYISLKGNVVVVSSKDMLNYHIQVYNSKGKELLVRKISHDSEQFQQVLFNEKGNLLIAVIDAKTGKLKLEWYDTVGKIIKKISISMPKRSNAKYAISYTDFITHIDNANNIFIRLTSDYIYKYNISGKLVAKTKITNSLSVSPLWQDEDQSRFGLLYSRSDLKLKPDGVYDTVGIYYTLYSYK
ncbi:PQQ-binding-like beta-propeller repeat protein [Peribacillus asahii]|uniref:Pyrrolo-quinoline quinone repeat domain-containing protein n=1 Tax=Peribacillus asahii TaxID=228899 RepID=A0A3T0KRL6_9BACI|nr:PQQ-binding-like beta-propeller repeat protein [Peribacillus asahii]AZV43092.1 hypothetical protein BAOM_2483 [Peribacillus asahii]USK83205.1 PQQ-binding-like beta-propeller repeat protein [Peribacillus asahii]